MRVLVLGGDGYLGWPTAMHFSAKGHEVAVLDNYLRRNLARETDNEILYPTPNLHERTRIWKEHCGKDMPVYIGDLCDWSFINRVFAEFQPDTIIHYAEQPSAPYSMLNADAARLTLNNNIGATGNVVLAMKEHCPDAHLIKLGTMGEYGTPNIDIEEGWLDIEHKGRSQKFLFPRQAGSLYHTTKVMDTDLLWFYVRTWGLRVTDLMQGPVYGIFTDENQHDDRLLPCFAYDEVFGTVLNRFAVQAVAGHPLTVYGKGGQTRGYLNIKDTLQCLLLAAENPANTGELKIYNQFTETFSVNQLADWVQKVGNSMGLSVEVKGIDNPRKEMEEHYYSPAHTGLLELGLHPTLLSEEVLSGIMNKVNSHREDIVSDRIFRGVNW
ncbi:NAD-dependent epimerase/dehydratase family protein [Parahaliea aestuarii]|uniref:NAD-dependent epimerase/dehydratase family protein n=1 Tax=Parahaliea aestuarii TaxID=1852021 RepID=A0A5C8ZNT2_9GAMM|nr:NAD-dependent epimerase/dehydratase family protein [Parahaliea aestuarii]TXS89424.1 NAD-dependent epimerase/dehydratase family protein [Parahaliea aestuarii]